MAEITTKDIMSWTRLGMRKAFGDMMCKIAQEHDDVFVLAADVASSANLKEFSERYPERFLNVGIAEQNMVGIATGLAKEGYNVFITTFAPFASMRAYEAIRSLVGYMHLNVKIVALASGVSLGVQGSTHYCLEDISLMRSIPGMMLLSPADCTEEMSSLYFLSQYNGPAYIRLTGVDGTPVVYKKIEDFRVDAVRQLREGNDVLFLGTGGIVSECIRTARSLKKDDISCAVYNVSCLKPFLLNDILGESHAYKLIVSVEEHFICGGLGSIVSEQLVNRNTHPKLIRIGIEDTFPRANSYAVLLMKNGLTADAIRNVVIENLNEG